MQSSKLNIPKICQICMDGPLGCLRSMNILCSPAELASKRNSPEAHTVDTFKLFSALKTVGLPKVLAVAWERIGGVSIGYLTEPVVLHSNGDVEACEDLTELEKASVMFCKVLCEKCNKMAMLIVSINRMAHLADACIYDPACQTNEHELYTIMGGVGAWLRESLGDGWGLRMEVYHSNYCPQELKNYEEFWLMLMCLLKVYTPNIRMLDTQAALRIECAKEGCSLSEICRCVIEKLCKMTGVF